METKNYLAAILAVGLVIVALFLALNSKSNAVMGQNGLQRDTISTSGTSTLTVDSNKAEVYVKIVTLEKTAQESKNRNSQASANVIKALKREGVKDADIETSQFSISLKYEYQEVIDSPIRNAKPVLVGYEVTNILKVTTQILEKVGKLIDAAVDSGANEIDRVSFGLTKEREKEVKQQAMIMASDDAKDKAAALATNLGVSLLKPVSISESSFYYQPYALYSEAAPLMKSAAETTISPRKLDVSASVNLVYEIR